MEQHKHTWERYVGFAWEYCVKCMLVRPCADVWGTWFNTYPRVNGTTVTYVTTDATPTFITIVNTGCQVARNVA